MKEVADPNKAPPSIAPTIIPGEQSIRNNALLHHFYLYCPNW